MASRKMIFVFLIKGTLQFTKIDMDRLLNKPYVNGVILRGQNLSLKFCESLEQKLEVNRGSRCFQRDTVSLCRSKVCKVTVRQTLWIIKSSRTQAVCVLFDSGQAADFVYTPPT